MYTREQALKDVEQFLEMAEDAEAAGDKMKAGIWRVEAHNSISRIGMTKIHRPNIGPYTPDNPKRCMDCHKPGDQWVPAEECLPTTS